MIDRAQCCSYGGTCSSNIQDDGGMVSQFSGATTSTAPLVSWLADSCLVCCMILVSPRQQRGEQVFKSF